MRTAVKRGPELSLEAAGPLRKRAPGSGRRQRGPEGDDRDGADPARGDRLLSEGGEGLGL